MCGIYITNIGYEKELVVKKLESFRYRGPDNLGYEKVDNISLGHLRLSILDPDKRSNQPFEFDSSYITYNGEIYNFQEVRDELIKDGYTFDTTSDTEVLIKGYRKWGKSVLDKLNGMFAFAIYDTHKEQVFCARDRLGVKPFYYYWENGNFEISSQLRPLINKESKISEQAVSIYLDCGYVPSPYSIIENVFKLPPGNFMVIDIKRNTRTVTEYWNLKPAKIRNISYEDAKTELHELLKDAVKIRLRSDVPLGAFLSGGVDSALVSGIASRVSEKPINTFTIGFDDPKFDESKVARQFADIIGSNHIETQCSANDAIGLIGKLVEVYDEPFADSSALPSLLLNKITKNYVTVALSGDGGDESFLGYDHFDAVNRFRHVNKIPYAFRKTLSKLIPNRKYAYILAVKNMREFIKIRFTGYNSLQKNVQVNWWQYYDDSLQLSNNPIQQTADLNIKLWLENDSNVKVDRASMAYSVEVRSPFLDYRVIEFARSLPVKYRYKKGRKKHILKDILSEYIPESVFSLPKKGFAVPMRSWLLKELKGDVLNKLSDEFLARIPNLDINKIKRRMDLHFNEKEDYKFDIWKLYVLALWYEEFNF